MEETRVNQRPVEDRVTGVCRSRRRPPAETMGHGHGDGGDDGGGGDAENHVNDDGTSGS